MTSEALGTFHFDISHQYEFARLSGDWNPVHVDPVQARRTPAGSLVVHGVHVVCRCIEALAATSADVKGIGKLTARFGRPVFVNDEIVIVLAEASESRFSLQACVGEIVATQVTLTRNTSVTERHAMPPSVARFDQKTPCDLSFIEIASAKGGVGATTSAEGICRHFPAAFRLVGGARIAALLSVSRIIGMQCPGLYSLLAGMDLEFGNAEGQEVRYEVRRVDERLRRVSMAVEGLGVRGTVDAFVRHPPAGQLSFSEVTTQLAPTEFRGQSALVVGGSRGLGELTSKIIAAGGGHPILTYNVGADDARAVQAEITGAGALCDVIRYDVRESARTQVDQLPQPISSLYYYATGPIFRRKTRVFEPALLEEFMQFYVYAFQELCIALLAQARGRLSVFCPSSTAVSFDDRPKGITEYAMAKGACEILCEDLMRQCAELTIITARLPRLATDQTSSFVPANMPNTLDILLPIVREVQSRGLST